VGGSGRESVRNSNETNGRKPYRTYTSGRAKRSSLDEELTSGAPARQTEPRNGGSSGDASRRSAPDGASPTYRRYNTDPAGTSASRPDKAVNGKRPAGRRRSRRWWVLPVGALLVLAIAGVVLTVLAWPGYKKFDRAVDKSNHQIDGETRAQLTPDDGSIWRKGTTILLFGVDSKKGEAARSDTIMLMRFNPSSRTVNQLSIARDTRVALPNGTYDKINAAMFWGGPSMAVATVKKYLGIDVNHVMVVNFQGFPRLVNAVGGVDIDVPKTISTVAGAQGRVVTFNKGVNHMDGKNAMLYVRIRLADDDLHRAARQQQFVQALQEKLAKPSTIPKIPEIGKRFMNGIATDLTTNEILELGFLKWRAKGGKKIVLAGEPGWEGGVSYIYPPSDAEKQKLIEQFMTY
jgi:LCP family protein required for cell wall assembly